MAWTFGYVDAKWVEFEWPMPRVRGSQRRVPIGGGDAFVKARYDVVSALPKIAATNRRSWGSR